MKTRRQQDDEAPGEAAGEQSRRADGAILVRGFRASMSASRTRLNAMATERARNHRDHDPQRAFHRPCSREISFAPRQQRSGQRERQREDGVLELDHFERQPHALEKSTQAVTGATFLLRASIYIRIASSSVGIGSIPIASDFAFDSAE